MHISMRTTSSKIASDIIHRCYRAMKTTVAASPSNIRNEGGDTGVKNTTTLISNRSRKLADQKEEKDRKLLSQLMSNANARAGPEQPDGGDSVRNILYYSSTCTEL
jgi:hypothetical protein